MPPIPKRIFLSGFHKYACRSIFDCASRGDCTRGNQKNNPASNPGRGKSRRVPSRSTTAQFRFQKRETAPIRVQLRRFHSSEWCKIITAWAAQEFCNRDIPASAGARSAGNHRRGGGLQIFPRQGRLHAGNSQKTGESLESNRGRATLRGLEFRAERRFVLGLNPEELRGSGNYEYRPDQSLAGNHSASHEAPEFGFLGFFNKVSCHAADE